MFIAASALCDVGFWILDILTKDYIFNKFVSEFTKTITIKII